MSNTFDEIFKCSMCIYTTKRKYNLIRHQNAAHKELSVNNIVVQKSCDTNANIDVKHIHSDVQHIHPTFKSIHPTFESIHPELEHIHQNKQELSSRKQYNCIKCSNQYKTSLGLKNHEKKCQGIDILTCPRCMKSFSSTSNKSKHRKLNTCKPRSVMYSKSFSEKSVEINNNTHINHQNNIQNQNNTYIQTQNNVYINNYGSERIDHISNEDLKNMLTSSDNTIPLYVEKKHFDKNFPENRNIIITRDNKCMVKEKNDWTERNISLFSSKLINDSSKKIITIL